MSRLLIVSLRGGFGVLGQLRRSSPVTFAAACGFAVACIGLAGSNDVLGSGEAHTRQLLDNADTHASSLSLYTPLKLAATWLTAWSGVSGGLFTPSIAVGASLGRDVAWLLASPAPTTLILFGMAGFLAAMTQAPITAAVIVMEITGSAAMAVDLTIVSLISSLIAARLSAPLYAELAALQLQQHAGTRAH